MSAFEPVFLPPDRVPQGRVPMTFLRHYNRCPRAGFLYLLTRGQVRTAEMMRGAAGHAILERATRAMLERPEPEPTIPGEVVKVIVDEVLADPAFPVPFEEHDYLREAAYRWASETAINPQAVLAVETLFALEVAGWQVRCKIDFAEALEDGAAVAVRDYKTGRGAPSYEDVARKLPDGRLMAKNFQLVTYALALAFGVPVRVEPCQMCALPPMLVKDAVVQPVDLADAARIYDAADQQARILPCGACEGRGRVEIPEPFPLAGRAQRFDLEFVFPGIEDREGNMARRPVYLTRAELDQYRASLEGLVRRVQHSVETGDWPAVVSDAACDECPAAALCPIPAELRDHRGTVNTVEQAREAFEVRHREKKVTAAKSRELREFVKHNGPVRYGDGMVAELVYSEHEEIADKDGFLAAVERAVRYGEPLERWRFVKTKGLNRLKERELTADELLEESLVESVETEGSE